MIELIVADLQAAYTRRMKAIADMVRPVMERVYEDRKGQLDTNIYFPSRTDTWATRPGETCSAARIRTGREIFKVFSRW